MNQPHIIAIFIAIGLYIISEIFLWRFPSKRFLKYIPGLTGMIASVVIIVISYQHILSFSLFIDYLFFSIVLLCLSGLASVIISMRRPYKSKEENVKSPPNPMKVNS
ncbi:hypothetical protein LGQ02_06845 [Bacillus shivajii]|uniref:hypothetical protein n=1 Tax=Bacillus shivajii TaxID=1983719 RepID=UPI001CFA2456|nr:hypothetical protein [Bacillus shivajii]UCZ54474.1 hypothetical protein LGQ02_06845 [Bacillus shivajii]